MSTPLPTVWAGCEVTISYFGADQLIPLGPRRDALRKAFGFDCGCARCQGEAGTQQAVGATVEAVAQVGDGLVFKGWMTPVHCGVQTRNVEGRAVLCRHLLHVPLKH